MKTFKKFGTLVWKEGLIDNSHDLFMEEVIRSITKHCRDRGEWDLQIITKYIEQTKYFKKLKLETSLDHQSQLDKLPKFLARKIQYIYLEKDEILFRENDIGDKFFLILKGLMNIYKSQLTEEEMTINQYIELLVKMKKDKDFDILRRTIKLNQAILPLELKDLDDIYEIIFYLKVRRLYYTSSPKEKFKELYEEYGKINDMFSLLDSDDYCSIEDNDFLKKIKKYLVTYSNFEEAIHKYSFLDKTSQIKVFKYLRMKFELSIPSGGSLGDYALQSKLNLRSATVQAASNSHLAYIMKDVYMNYIQEQNKKILKKEIHFFIDHLFKGIPYDCFLYKYFPLFIALELNSREIIFENKTVIDFIYLISEGEVEISVKMCLKDIDNYITRIRKILNIKEELTKTNLSEELCWKKRLFRLSIYGVNQVLGIKEFFYFDSVRLFDAQVQSIKAKLYKISVDKFKKMLHEEKGFSKHLQIVAKNKLENLLDRLLLQRTYIADESNRKNGLIAGTNPKVKTLSQPQNLLEQTNFTAQENSEFLTLNKNFSDKDQVNLVQIINPKKYSRNPTKILHFESNLSNINDIKPKTININKRTQKILKNHSNSITNIKTINHEFPTIKKKRKVTNDEYYKINKDFIDSLGLLKLSDSSVLGKTLQEIKQKESMKLDFNSEKDYKEILKKNIFKKTSKSRYLTLYEFSRKMTNQSEDVPIKSISNIKTYFKQLYQGFKSKNSVDNNSKLNNQNTNNEIFISRRPDYSNKYKMNYIFENIGKNIKKKNK